MKTKSKKSANVPNLRFPGFVGEWPEMRFAEVGTFFKGKGISKDQLSTEGRPCILYGELYTKYKDEVITEVYSKTNIDPAELIASKYNDVIIPSSGESAIDISTACCVNVDGVLLGGDLNIIRPHKANGNFISYQLNGKRKQDIAKIAQGSSVIHLYNDSLKGLIIALPDTKKEQDRIAQLLSLIDSRIQTQRKIIDNLESLIKSLRTQLFSRKLLFRDVNNKKFPDWRKQTLGSICNIVGGGTPDTSKNEYWNGEIQWFTPTEIKSNFVSKSERTITSLGLKNSSAKVLPKGAILLTTRATIGDVAIALEKCTTNQGFQSLIVNNEYNPLFVFNWIKSNRHELIKRANGSTFPEISKSEVENIDILIPSFAEQTRIANLLLSLDNKIEVEKMILFEYENQKKHLLQNLFI